MKTTRIINNSNELSHLLLASVPKEKMFWDKSEGLHADGEMMFMESIYKDVFSDENEMLHIFKTKREISINRSVIWWLNIDENHLFL